MEQQFHLTSPKHSTNLHLGAKASTYQNAKELRQVQTEAEQKLWSFLRNKQLNGKKFRRQHAIADYVVDFYCHECKLAIELDGSFHQEEEAKENDEARTTLLNENGIKVLRFWNEEVIKEVEKGFGEYWCLSVKSNNTFNLTLQSLPKSGKPPSLL
jgi:very-short-patch-repair endonuclease